MDNKKLFLLVSGIILLFIAIGIDRFQNIRSKDSVGVGLNSIVSVPKNFDECLNAGNKILESYPRQCLLASGDVFEEQVGNVFEKADLIVVESPRPNEVIKSPLTISGKARGYWFFEASFPVSVVNDLGVVIGEGIATATDEWMTEEFVPFTLDVTFGENSVNITDRGKLILRKSNPSGLPENDDLLEMPIRLK